MHIAGASLVTRLPNFFSPPRANTTPWGDEEVIERDTALARERVAGNTDHRSRQIGGEPFLRSTHENKRTETRADFRFIAFIAAHFRGA